MPRLGYGTWQNTKDLDILIKEAINVGYRHIDTAVVYRNEDQVGKGVKDSLKQGNVKREDLFIVTKVWNNEKSDVAKSLNASLQRLELDYVDLLLIHWPIGEWIKEKQTFKQVPLHKTWKDLESLVKAGKTRAIGVSNFNVQLLLDLLSYAEVKPACNQVEVHPYLTQEDLIGFCKKNGIEIVAYCPLGGNVPGKPGILSQYNNTIFIEFSVKTLVEEPIIKELAKKHGKTPAQIILNWHLSRGYTIIPKTATQSRLKENFESSSFELTGDELKKISSLNRDVRVADPREWEAFGNTPVFS